MNAPISDEDVRLLRCMANDMTFQQIADETGETLDQVNARVEHLCLIMGTKTPEGLMGVAFKLGIIA